MGTGREGQWVQASKQGAASVSQRQGREKGVFHTAGHFLDGCNRQGWARPKPRAQLPPGPKDLATTCCTSWELGGKRSSSMGCQKQTAALPTMP